jgi:hypothetical protein
MANLIDTLLKADAGKLTEKPKKQYEVKRLSEALKTPFVLTLQAIPAELYTEIQTNAVDVSKKGNINKINIYKMQLDTLVNGIVEPDLKNKQLLEHFKAATPKELISKLLLAGEIADIAGEVSKLTGYDKDQSEVDEEVKN